MSNKRVPKISIDGEKLKRKIYESGYSIRSISNAVGYNDRTIRDYIAENEMPYPLYFRITNKIEYRGNEDLINILKSGADNGFVYISEKDAKRILKLIKPND